MTEKTSIEFSEREALFFHSTGRPGKIEIIASKPMATQRDLSLAYSPGVAVPVLAIAKDPATAYDYTAKGNLVAVISNGTAILGLGNLGALASKPVIPRHSSTPSPCSNRPSAASTLRTSGRPTASLSSRRSGSGSRSRSCTMTSTAPRSSARRA
jgi:hypothetical protein